MKKSCSFIGGNWKTAFPQFEENQKKPEGCFVQLSSKAMKKVAFPQFEENQKKPEGCF
jgi:hypothetical protein